MTKKKDNIASDAKGLWLLPSNHQNLLFMFGSGLISGPDGFEYGGESKYYKDILSLCPGWIPLFKGCVPEKALSLPTEAATNLVSATAALNMDNYLGEVYVSTASGEWEMMPFAKAVDGYSLILVPAPLPVSWIVNIAFENEAARNSFRYAADDFANVDISGLQLIVSGIHGENQLSLNCQNDSERDILKDFAIEKNNERMQERAQAFGGIVAMLYHFANLSDLCTEVFRSTRFILSSSDVRNEDYYIDNDDPIVSGLPYWLAQKSIPCDDLRTSFFFGLLEDIIQNRKECVQNELTAIAHEYIVNQVNHSVGFRDNWRALPKLLEELSRPELLLADQFEKFKGTISHALLLFFQRENCEELLDFQSQNPHVALSDADIIAAALLFGARDGWIGLAKKYRWGISKWTTSLMASKAQASDKVAIQIHKQEPTPLREYFTGGEWNANEKHALDLARKCKWEECLQTLIKVPKSYRVEDGYLVLPGDVKGSAIKTDVDRELFLKSLRDISINEEQLIRTKIRGIAE
jgi:hypothetical protein